MSEQEQLTKDDVRDIVRAEVQPVREDVSAIRRSLHGASGDHDKGVISRMVHLEGWADLSKKLFVGLFMAIVGVLLTMLFSGCAG